MPTLRLKLLFVMRQLLFCFYHAAAAVKSSYFIRIELSLIGGNIGAVPGACSYALFIKSAGYSKTARVYLHCQCFGS
jgi:hypothetical protein